MNREQLVNGLLEFFLAEPGVAVPSPLPSAYEDKRRLLHGLLDSRLPLPVPEAILEKQDFLLQQEREERGVVPVEDIPSVRESIPRCSLPESSLLSLWQGDITRLRVDAIVNAANSQMLGCFIPLHACIDNAIHAAAGVRLRLACHEMMIQDYPEGNWEEPTGQARITKGYNLPSSYVIHTVGPIVTGQLGDAHRRLLASCYHACLEVAVSNSCASVAFCSISTGVFRFPREEAARIAIDTVTEFLRTRSSCLQRIVFNVFSQQDYHIYRTALEQDRAS